MRRRPAAQGGLTLVELMVSMAVTSVLLIFLFGVQTRMTVALHGQSRASDVNTVLGMAGSAIQRDLELAGYLLPAGAVSVAPGVDASGLLSGLTVTNDADGTGPDQVRMHFADDRRIAVVDSFGPVFVGADQPSLFADGERIIIATASAACLVEVTNTNPNQIHFNPNRGGQPYNDPGAGSSPNPHCDDVRSSLGAGEATFVYSFSGRAYRIDPDRREASVLQMSPSGGLVDDWIDLGVGFTNLQVASRYFEDGDAVDLDGDGDPERDWYSGEGQESPDSSGERPAGAVLTQVSVSVEVRGHSSSSGVITAATPAFTDPESPTHNRLGDWGGACDGAARDPCGIDLAGTEDADRPLRYRGDHIYRWTTLEMDLRNIGVGI